MAKTNTIDMTKGDPVKHLIVFAIPALIGNIFQQVYNLADTAIVGHYVGKDALAAVGACASITFLFFALCNGIGSGGGIIASQYYGAHDDDKVKNCIVNTGLIMLLVPALFGTVGFITAPLLLQILGTPAEIIAGSTLYVRYMCCGLVFVSIYNYLCSMLRALGDSRSPLYFLIMSTIVNLVLDVLFVKQFNMGIQGAALATVISQFISAISCGIYAVKKNPYFKLSKKDFVINREMSFKVIRLGVPMSLQFSLIAISSMAVQSIVNSYGTTTVAAFTSTNRIEQLIHQPYATLGAALSTFCGQNYGAKQNERVYEGYRKGMRLMVIMSMVMTFTMFFLGRAVCSLFVSDTEVIELGALGLRINSIFYMALGLIYVIRGVLTGVGDAFFALLNGIVEVIGRFTLPLLMTGYAGFGETGIWLSTGLVWVLSGVTAYMRYLKHKDIRMGRNFMTNFHMGIDPESFNGIFKGLRIRKA